MTLPKDIPIATRLNNPKTLVLPLDGVDYDALKAQAEARRTSMNAIVRSLVSVWLAKQQVGNK